MAGVLEFRDDNGIKKEYTKESKVRMEINKKYLPN